MKPIEFPEQNFTATSNDENVKPLPVCVSPDGFQTISCWEVTDEDIPFADEFRRATIPGIHHKQP